MLTSDWFSRAQLEQHSVELRQFADFREVTLANGMRAVEAYNAAGLSYTVLPDRGLDIWSAHYRGIPLTWLSQGSPHAPGLSPFWLRQFNGGLLVTCGLTHAGPPADDPLTDGGRDLHGLYSRLRAYNVATGGGWEGDHYVLTLRGSVSESKLFGEQLRLERTYRLPLDAPVVAWSDRVVNLGDQPAPLMVLYHINLGYPLIQAGMAFHSPHAAVYARDPEARKGYDRWPHYDGATPGYAEQVYFHHLKADASGQTTVALLHDAFGLQFEWDSAALPYVTQWKNTRQGIYVSGIEPGNCIPEGQVVARETGRLVWLQPGEARQFGVTLTVLDGAPAVAACRARIADLQQSGTPVSGVKLDDYAG